MPYAHFTYTVIGQRVVAPTDVDAAVANVGYTRLVLSACTPLFSAAKRLLVYARLTRTVPVGAARGFPGGAIARPIEAARRRRRGPRAARCAATSGARTPPAPPALPAQPAARRPAGPSSTSPIQVTSTPPAVAPTASSHARAARRATQKQSS